MGANDLFGIPSSNPTPGGYTKREQFGFITFGPGFGTLVGTPIVNSYRIGDRLFCQGQIQCGTVANSEISLQLPAGLNINGALLIGGTTLRLGIWNIFSTGAGFGIFPIGKGGALFYDQADTTKLFMAYQTASNVYVKDTGTTILGNQQYMDFEFSVPIRQWAVTSV